MLEILDSLDDTKEDPTLFLTPVGEKRDEFYFLDVLNQNDNVFLALSRTESGGDVEFFCVKNDKSGEIYVPVTDNDAANLLFLKLKEELADEFDFE